jgi:hypothetical protein
LLAVAAPLGLRLPWRLAPALLRQWSLRIDPATTLAFGALARLRWLRPFALAALRAALLTLLLEAAALGLYWCARAFGLSRLVAATLLLLALLWCRLLALPLLQRLYALLTRLALPRLALLRGAATLRLCRPLLAATLLLTLLPLLLRRLLRCRRLLLALLLRRLLLRCQRLLLALLLQLRWLLLGRLLPLLLSQTLGSARGSVAEPPLLAGRERLELRS